MVLFKHLLRTLVPNETINKLSSSWLLINIDQQLAIHNTYYYNPILVLFNFQSFITITQPSTIKVITLCTVKAITTTSSRLQVVLSVTDMSVESLYFSLLYISCRFTLNNYIGFSYDLNRIINYLLITILILVSIALFIIISITYRSKIMNNKQLLVIYNELFVVYSIMLIPVNQLYTIPSKLVRYKVYFIFIISYSIS
jgi:hypothetical protein